MRVSLAAATRPAHVVLRPHRRTAAPERSRIATSFEGGAPRPAALHSAGRWADNLRVSSPTGAAHPDRSGTDPRPADDHRVIIQAHRYRRRTRWVLTWTIFAWAAVISATTYLAVSADSLLRHGVRTTGVVVNTYYGARLSRYATIRFVANGRPGEGTLPITSSASYRPGDAVTVIYSHSDPANFRTPQDSHQGGWITLLIGLAIVPLGLLTTWAIRTTKFSRNIRRCLGNADRWRSWQYPRLPGNGLVLTDPDNADAGAQTLVLMSNLGYVGSYKPPPAGTLLIAGDPNVFGVVSVDNAWRPVVVSPLRRRRQRALLADTVSTWRLICGRSSRTFRRAMWTGSARAADWRALTCPQRRQGQFRGRRQVSGCAASTRRMSKV
jgi:hypothetical protein